jgi:hypothetical protein
MLSGQEFTNLASASTSTQAYFPHHYCLQGCILPPVEPTRGIVLYGRDGIVVIPRRHVCCHRAGKSRSMPNHGYRHPAANGVLTRVVPVQHFAQNSHRSWQPSSEVARFTRADALPIDMFS